jgi:sarcosine oxidase subunit alpha
LLDAGEDLGVQPFGVEAQRILRLEKGHFIVGQDTDGLTQGFGVGVDWAIKLDKTDFVGKPELAWQSERGDHRHLVAIQTEDPGLVPVESCQIVDPDGTIRGRITSSRMSPTLGRSISLGQVDTALNQADQIVQIRLPNGKHAPARVLAEHAHFDPEGTRARG